MNAPHSTPNGPGSRAYCAHCGNAGIVVLDTACNMHGAPCPMCEKGLVVASRAFDLADYWQTAHVDTTWENGLTMRHIRRCQMKQPGAEYPCGRPSVGGECDYHAEHAPRPARKLPAVKVGAR